jgi:septum formation protein
MSAALPMLVLASASPRRAELLARLGIRFSIFPVETPERLRPGQSPRAQARRLALEKASAAAARLSTAGPQPGWALGADTLVWLAGRALGKPRDPAQAEAMLRRLSGRSHQVVTGLALAPLFGSARAITLAESTRVFFRKLGEDEIKAYVRSGEPLDKAGAYGIQGQAGAFVRRIEGCYFNVMGLPLARTAELLERAGLG